MTQSELPDLAIAGCGMAGWTAALWARRLGLNFLLFEASNFGGQISWIKGPIPDYPGSLYESGEAFLQALEKQRSEMNIRPVMRKVGKLVIGDSCVCEQTEKGIYPLARRVLVATGLERNIPGLQGVSLPSVHFSASGNKEMFRGKQVVILGGGDGAFENAIMLSGIAAKIQILHRSEPRARPLFQKQCQELGVELLRGEAVSYDGESLKYKKDHVHSLMCNCVLVKTGFKPVVRIVEDICELKDGFIVVNEKQQTSQTWIYAAGDVCEKEHPSLVQAAASAARAVREIERSLR